MLPQNQIHKLYDEVVKLMWNETFRKTMEQNLERVNDLNDTSKIVADLEALARKGDE